MGYEWGFNNVIQTAKGGVSARCFQSFIDNELTLEHGDGEGEEW